MDDEIKKVYKRMFYELTIYGNTKGPTEQEKKMIEAELESEFKKEFIQKILKEL